MVTPAEWRSDADDVGSLPESFDKVLIAPLDGPIPRTRRAEPCRISRHTTASAMLGNHRKRREQPTARGSAAAFCVLQDLQSEALVKPL